MTEEISSEKHVTLSKILVFINAMLTLTKKFEIKSNLPQEVKSMVTTLLTQLNKQFLPMVDNYLVTNAALLDSRIKNIAFSGFSK